MEIEEEEVKLEATEPEKDRAVRTLRLRFRRLPELDLSLLKPLDLSRFKPLDLSPVTSLDLSHEDLLPELRSWNDQSLQELMEEFHYFGSPNTQQPLPELQANDNRLENLAPSVPSQDDSMNDNDVNQHVTITVEKEQLLDAGESSRPRVRTMETTLLRIGEIFLTALFTTNHFLVQEISGWTLLVTNLIVEIASAVFDQMGYALIGMVLAFVALLLAAAELIHMALKERIILPVGTIVEYFGLAGAAWQFVYSTVEYTYTRQDKDNPIKMCLLPLIFLLCVVISKLLVDKRSIDKSS